MGSIALDAQHYFQKIQDCHSQHNGPPFYEGVIPLNSKDGSEIKKVPSPGDFVRKSEVLQHNGWVTKTKLNNITLSNSPIGPASNQGRQDNKNGMGHIDMVQDHLKQGTSIEEINRLIKLGKINPFVGGPGGSASLAGQHAISNDFLVHLSDNLSSGILERSQDLLTAGNQALYKTF